MAEKYIYKGIDVSKHQGNIYWEKVAKEVDFVILRACFGKYSHQIDSKFIANIEGAIAAGIKHIGCYTYSYALSVEDAEKEADIILGIVKKYKKHIDLPIYFDIEDPSQRELSRDTQTKMCITFCNKIKEAGYRYGCYQNKWWLENLVSVDKFPAGTEIWVAQYNSVCTYKGEHNVWQYSSKGKVSGIAGNVDMNYATADLIRKPEAPAPKWTKDARGWKYGSLKNAWKKIDGHWYWFNADGYAVTGWHKLRSSGGEAWYYFLTAEDAARTGLKECACFSLDKS